MSHRIKALCFVALVGSTSAGAEAGWETVATEPILVKTRAIPGSPIKEVWAEGEIAAEVQDIQVAVMNVDRFPKFMPYVKEARFVLKDDPDGSRYTYTRIEPPVVSSRDYVLRVTLEQATAPDGSGEFKNRWVAVSDKLPKRANYVRLSHNQGSWHVKPKGNGKSHGVYKFSVDPGGWVPAFAADMGNKQGVSETFKAIEKEAQRLAEIRKASAPRLEAAKPRGAAEARVTEPLRDAAHP